MNRLMNIGEAADAAGVSAKMIRHYEQIGLMPAAHRTDAGYRQYAERDVSILRFIRQSRRLGFSMEQIGELLGLWSDDHRASREVKALAQAHLDVLEAKMREMAEMQQALRRLIHACHGDDDPHCAILEELAVSSPQAPPPGAVGVKPAHKAAHQPALEPAHKSAARKASAKGAETAAASAHADLMAWTRSIHTGPAPG